MKKIYACFFLLACLPPTYATQGGNFGAGLRLGTHFGFDFKYRLNTRNAIGFALGWGSSNFGNRYGYSDGQCYDANFYDSHRSYCNGIRFDYYNRYGQYGYSSFHLHADYLIHNYNVIKASFPMPLYYGPGVQYEYLRYYSAWLAVRGTIGLDFMPPNIPFDFFVELTPVFWFLPGPLLDMYGGVGARYWF